MHSEPRLKPLGSKDTQSECSTSSTLAHRIRLETPRVMETRMDTVQASRTIPLRPQWAWHYLCDVLRWDVFLPFVTEVRRLEGERFELGWSDGRSCQMKLVLREPTERLEWRTTDPGFAGGAIDIERLGFRTRVTVRLDLHDGSGPSVSVLTLQVALEAGLDRLVVHLSDREPVERGIEPARVVSGLQTGSPEDVSRLPRRLR
jgi:Polyketide cyclase / dehydrase and lipid transport